MFGLMYDIYSMSYKGMTYIYIYIIYISLV